MNKRFYMGKIQSAYVVIDLPPKAYNDLPEAKRDERILVRISYGGMVSETLASTWTNQIADQLNQFDVANATVAKLQ